MKPARCPALSALALLATFAAAGALLPAAAADPAGRAAAWRAPDATAIRSTLWIDVYACSIFAGGDQRALLAGKFDAPVTIRFDITTDMLPERAPPDWRAALDPVLGESDSEELAQAFATLGDGDSLVFDYLPDSGTRVYAGDALLFHTEDEALIAAVSGMLLGSDPVSVELREELVSELREAGQPD